MTSVDASDFSSFEKSADLRFANEVLELYEDVGVTVHELADEYQNNGIASGCKYARKAAEQVIAKFKSVAKTIEDIYVAPLFATVGGSSAEKTEWLRRKIDFILPEQLRRAQIALETACRTFGSFARTSDHVARLQGQDAVLRSRLDSVIALAALHSTSPTVSVSKQDAEAAATMVLRESENPLKIFISHSSKDMILATALIDLLRSALGMTADQIRCSSVDGYRLPAGVNTEQQLRDEIKGSQVMLGLITPNSLTSQYVMFELGARWGAGLPLIPLLAGVEPKDLGQPLSLLNNLSTNSDSQIYQLVDDIATRLQIPAQSAASYTQHVAKVRQIAGTVGETKPTTAPQPETKQGFHNVQFIGARTTKLGWGGDTGGVLWNENVGKSGDIHAVVACFRNEAR